jgi:hypothetical protein
MRVARHRFFAVVAICCSTLAAGGAILAGSQTPTVLPKPPAPAETGVPGPVNSPAPEQRALKRAQMLRNQQEFREGVDRLFQLSGELRDEVQHTPNADVFSLRMYKKTQEIEKLVKQLKSKAKGE